MITEQFDKECKTTAGEFSKELIIDAIEAVREEWKNKRGVHTELMTAGEIEKIDEKLSEYFYNIEKLLLKK